MLSHKTPTVVLLFWILVAGVYVWAAARQKSHVNLSAAAGGQYPYLMYAKGIAQDGLTGHFGDRNRMPLYPALVAMIHHPDWDTFVDRSAWFSVFSSLAVLNGLGLLFLRVLTPWPAAVLTLTAAFIVFIPNASFVQPELLYYGLFFVSLVMLCRLIRRPTPGLAAAAGFVLGLAYLTKASALPTIAAYVAVALTQAVIRAVVGRNAGSGGPSEAAHATPGRIGLCAAVVLVVFLATVYPYISNSRAKFGRYFYNVNSTFFMWCDNWAQAQAFADRYHISEGYPDAPPDQIPGPLNYWRTHDAGRIVGRLTYGLRTLASMAYKGSYGKYLAAAIALAAIVAIRNAQRIRRWNIEDLAVGVFCALVLAAYTFVYAWYVPVAYGDRFILSLVLPVMFGAFWLAERGWASDSPTQIFCCDDEHLAI